MPGVALTPRAAACCSNRSKGRGGIRSRMDSRARWGSGASGARSGGWEGTHCTRNDVRVRPRRAPTLADGGCLWGVVRRLRSRTSGGARRGVRGDRKRGATHRRASCCFPAASDGSFSRRLGARERRRARGARRSRSARGALAGRRAGRGRANARRRTVPDRTLQVELARARREAAPRLRPRARTGFGTRYRARSDSWRCVRSASVAQAIVNEQKELRIGFQS